MARSAFGATISVDGTALAEVTSIGMPSISAGVIDVTTHDSPDRYRQFIRELRDVGEFSVTMMYTAGSATDDACKDACDSDEAIEIVITARAASGNETLTFDAFATNYEPDALEIDSPQTATLTLKPTGKITQAPAT
jgi:hypothetical protein